MPPSDGACAILTELWPYSNFWEPLLGAEQRSRRSAAREAGPHSTAPEAEDAAAEHAQEGGRRLISINLKFKQFVKSLHLAWSTASVLAQPLCDALPMPQQVSKRQRHLQHGDHTIPDLLEDLPSPLLATAGSPRGKKTSGMDHVLDE